MPCSKESPPSPEEKGKSALGRVSVEFRFNPNARYTSKAWPQVLKWRGRTFLLHNELGDGTAWYDAPSGPSKGEVVVDEDGFVLRGHDEEFNQWPVAEEELKS